MINRKKENSKILKKLKWLMVIVEKKDKNKTDFLNGNCWERFYIMIQTNKVLNKIVHGHICIDIYFKDTVQNIDVIINKIKIMHFIWL